jgi:peroxiredoxin
MKVKVGDKLPDAKVFIELIDNKEVSIKEIIAGKKTILFGLPGAFTPTCSEKHLPGFIKLYDRIKSSNIDDIYCLSVNDAFVMKAWLSSYKNGNNIKGIADGNGTLCQLLNVISDKSENFMGLRSQRFAMIVDNNNIINIFIEQTGKFEASSAENILSKL